MNLTNKEKHVIINCIKFKVLSGARFASDGNLRRHSVEQR